MTTCNSKSTTKNTPVGVGEYRDRGAEKMNYKSGKRDESETWTYWKDFSV